MMRVEMHCTHHRFLPLASIHLLCQISESCYCHASYDYTTKQNIEHK